MAEQIVVEKTKSVLQKYDEYDEHAVYFLLIYSYTK
jgi:hypothetical protein